MARLGRSFHEEGATSSYSFNCCSTYLSASFHFATPFYTVSVASRISSANSLQRLEYGVNCSGWNISISLPAKRAGAF